MAKDMQVICVRKEQNIFAKGAGQVASHRSGSTNRPERAGQFSLTDRLNGHPGHPMTGIRAIRDRDIYL
jgi:hypothetical protein